MDRFVAKSPLGSRIVALRDEILAAADALALEDVRVFGSVSRGDENERVTSTCSSTVAPGAGV